MKTELNEELKETFFAQYWKQKVLQKQGYENEEPINITRYTYQLICECPDLWYLLLKPLSAISDEDAKAIATIAVYNENRSDISLIGKRIADDLRGKGSHIKYFNAVHIIQYLQSKGYALPFMGYSVEELVEAGWVQLTP